MEHADTVILAKVYCSALHAKIMFSLITYATIVQRLIIALHVIHAYPIILWLKIILVFLVLLVKHLISALSVLNIILLSQTQVLLVLDVP